MSLCSSYFQSFHSFQARSPGLFFYYSIEHKNKSNSIDSYSVLLPLSASPIRGRHSKQVVNILYNYFCELHNQQQSVECVCEEIPFFTEITYLAHSQRDFKDTL